MARRFIFSLFVIIMASCWSTTVFAEGLTAKLCKEKVIAASELIGAEGEAAFAKIKDPNGPFRFADGAGYIWIQDLNAVVLMHPIKPSLDGKDMSGFQDKNGTLLFLNFSEICEDHGAGWVPYVWPHPKRGDGTFPKISYVKHVEHGGKDYVAGAGMYDVTPADIKKEFPGDAVFE